MDLKLAWLNWYTPVNPLDPTDGDQDQYYTTPEFGQTGTRTVTVNEPNPLYQPAYQAARQGGRRAESVTADDDATASEPSGAAEGSDDNDSGASSDNAA